MQRVSVSQRVLDLYLRECAKKAEELGIDAVAIAACMEATESGEYVANGFCLRSNNALMKFGEMMGTCQQIVVQNATKSIEDAAKFIAQQEAAAAEAAKAAATAEAPAPEATDAAPTVQ